MRSGQVCGPLETLNPSPDAMLMVLKAQVGEDMNLSPSEMGIPFC